MLRALLRRADVVVENFRVDGLDRFGLDYASVREFNRGIVYCSITGFGQDDTELSCLAAAAGANPAPD